MSGLDMEHAHDRSEPDEELEDADLQQEIELVSDVVLAASASDDPLSQAEIDRALGLCP
jgi:hypothetical protein